MATNNNFFWAGAVSSGLTISIPHYAMGQGLEIEIRSYTGDFRKGQVVGSGHTFWYNQ